MQYISRKGSTRFSALSWVYPDTSVHAACPYLCCMPCPCCMPMSMLHVHVHVACRCPYCISISVLHVHVHAAYPCPCCMCMSMLRLHVNNISVSRLHACPWPSWMFMSMLHDQHRLRVISMLHAHVYAECSCPCCTSMSCCMTTSMSMLQVQFHAVRRRTHWTDLSIQNWHEHAA